MNSGIGNQADGCNGQAAAVVEQDLGPARRRQADGLPHWVNLRKVL
jgi:hypothetical protein